VSEILDAAFDPVTQTWFTPCGLEARTVRELLSKAPEGSVVENYFPCGRAVTADERGYCVNALRDEADKRVPVVPEPPKPVYGNQGPSPRDVILDLWASGHSVGEIAALVGYSKVSINSRITAARGRGDPRAVRRYPPRRAAS
jgi:hypothetical protein